MVFGIKSYDNGDELSLASKVDPKLLKRTHLMTGIHMKLQQMEE